MTILDYIKELFPSRNYIARVISTNKQQLYDLQSELLWDKIYNDDALGISSERYCDHDVIVSLTTYGKRFYEVPLAIESIMRGSVKPNRIVLNIDNSFQKQRLPVSLLNQQKRGLEINYCRDIRSYTKLIPTLQKYPEAVIITIDDDAIYSRDLVEHLLRSYQERPDMIHACRMHRMTFQKNGTLDRYLNWNWQVNDDKITKYNYFTGVGGVLYPPHCFDEEVVNENVFLDICKYADDAWFNAMALKKGTLVKKAYTHSDKGTDYILNSFIQDTALCHINNAVPKDNALSMIDIQLKAVFDKYNLFEKLR